MLIRHPPDIAASLITPESEYWNRRRFVKLGLALLGGALLPKLSYAGEFDLPKNVGLLASDKLNTLEQISSYNNFYEYSSEKTAVKELAKNLNPRPWTIRIEGEVDNPRTIGIDDLLKEFHPQERIYRLRCVEGWSMVIPWDGIPLAELLKKAQPNSKAKYVRFISLHDPARFYGQRNETLEWPYTEGLTIAEAMHPLTLLATGIYGKPLPNQNGAPVRLAVPWKYGFKSIKSIVTIRLEEKQPTSTWMLQSPNDYGFYANVNPRQPYGNGSQSREVRIGELKKRETLLLNGYSQQVGSLYSGKNLDTLR